MTNGAPRRRYVSRAAGTYPAPVRPHRAVAAAAAVAEPLPEIDAPFEDDLEVRPGSGALQEPDLDALSAAPASPAFDDLTGDLGEIALEPRVPDFGLERMDPPKRPSSSWARQSGQRMLIGGVIGALAGVLVGLVLLALRRPDGLMSLKDPVTLWSSVGDSRDWLMAGLITLACALLGAAAAGRRRTARSPED